MIEVTENKTDTRIQNAVLRIGIDDGVLRHGWSLQEFSSFLDCITRLYALYELSKDDCVRFKNARDRDRNSEFVRAKEVSHRVSGDKLFDLIAPLLMEMRSAQNYAELQEKIVSFDRRFFHTRDANSLHDLLQIAAIVQNAILDSPTKRELSVEEWLSRGYYEESWNGMPGMLRAPRSLRLRKVQYSSPGFTDIAGLGQVLGHVKDLLVRIIDFYAAKRKQQIETKILEQELEAARLKNLFERARFLKEIGYTDEDRRRLLSEAAVQIKTIERLVGEKYVTSVQWRDEKDG